MSSLIFMDCIVLLTICQNGLMVLVTAVATLSVLNKCIICEDETNY